MIKEHFFPTIIYGKDVDLDNQWLENKIMEWCRQDQEGVTKTNVNGWHSKTDMHTRNEYKPLFDELFKMQFEIYNEEHLNRQPKLGNMWANINYTNSYNKPHVHPNALFSGVYYVKSPENSGELVFNDPRPGVQYMKPDMKKGELPKQLWREVRIKPKAGRILMFPAWLWHCVEQNKSNDIRISVSFNFIQDGFFQ
tara:strand:- start:136 stop:723 length:588 start_codon:yes stop_codon:yes gene_type:complete